MICPRCKSQNQYGNFCSNCGEKIKEKCVCGQMEPIKRPVCFTKIEEARVNLENYIKQHPNRWQSFLYRIDLPVNIVLGAFLPVAVLAFLGFATDLSKFIIPSGKDETTKMLVIAGGFAVIICCLLWNRLVSDVYSDFLIRLDKKQKEKATNEFFVNFPADAEILRKSNCDVY